MLQDLPLKEVHFHHYTVSELKVRKGRTLCVFIFVCSVSLCDADSLLLHCCEIGPAGRAWCSLRLK